MKRDILITMFEVVGSSLCVASGDGQKVFNSLSGALQKGCHVTLSFRNVTTLTPAFLNAAIGQLYGRFNEERIRSLLKVEDMRPEDTLLLNRIVDTAKQYFKDPERFEQAVREDPGDT